MQKTDRLTINLRRPAAVESFLPAVPGDLNEDRCRADDEERVIRCVDELHQPERGLDRRDEERGHALAQLSGTVVFGSVIMKKM